MLLCKQTNVTRQNDEMSAASKMTGHKASPSDMQAVAGPILSVFPALIVHSELKSVHPGFSVAFIFKHKLINK